MPYSYNQYTGNGVQQQYAISYPYLSRTHIEVYIDSVETESFTFLNDSMVTITPAPTNGAVVRVARNTPKDGSLVDYVDGSTLQESDLDTATLQQLYIAQEAFDRVDASIAQNTAGWWDAQNKRLINLATPVDATDAVTKAYADTTLDATADNVTAAQAAQTAAELARDETEDLKDETEDFRDEAQVARDQAVAAKSAAEAAAAGMKWRDSVRAASTANVNIASAPSSLDGVTLATGNRTLLKNQSTASQNGVYIFNGAGVAMTRATDADTWAELVSQVVTVEEGSTLTDTKWICTVNQGGTLGSTAVTWVDFILNPDGSITFAKLASAAIASQSDAETGTATDKVMTPQRTTQAITKMARKQGKETIWVPASAMIPRITNGPAIGTVEMTTNKNMFKTLDFDPGTAEYAQFQIRMPKSWNLGTVTFQPVWSHASTTTNFGCYWEMGAVAISDDDAGDAAFGSVQASLDTGGTTNDIYIGPESPAITVAGSPASGDLVMFQVNRAATSGSDTLAVDGRLHGVHLYFTTNAADDT